MPVYPGAPQLSTGPKSEQGGLVSSHNALKTGLTGRTIVLPPDDVAAYQTLVALIKQKFNPPATSKSAWSKLCLRSKLQPVDRKPSPIPNGVLRIPTLESGFYAIGRHELADCAHEPDVRRRATCLAPSRFPRNSTCVFRSQLFKKKFGSRHPKRTKEVSASLPSFPNAHSLLAHSRSPLFSSREQETPRTNRYTRSLA